MSERRTSASKLSSVAWIVEPVNGPSPLLDHHPSDRSMPQAGGRGVPGNEVNLDRDPLLAARLAHIVAGVHDQFVGTHCTRGTTPPNLATSCHKGALLV